MALIIGGVVIGALSLFIEVVVRYKRRERRLEQAVERRTRELLREREAEKARNSIMEMLVSHQSLGAVLDAIAQLICAEIPDTGCAFLLHGQERSHLAAALNIPGDWVRALSSPQAIPFDLRRNMPLSEGLQLDPAWRPFLSLLTSKPPQSIDTRPVGNPGAPICTILLFGNGKQRIPPESEIVNQAVRLVQIAIEHGRVYEDLQYQAHHDGLTGLPNRVLFEERLERSIRESRNAGYKFALLYIDLDRFKQINDSMSHRVGDLFLCEVASRMRQAVRPNDTVARIGGDEFNVLLMDIQGKEEAEAIAARLVHAIRQPAAIESHSLAVSASIGIAFFPDDASDSEGLRRGADAAMYCAKELGRDRLQVFSAQHVSLDRIRLEQELKTALRDNLFTVHYQPKISSSGLFGGVEALLRLHHPVHGDISPAVIIPLAEETGFIVPLGLWVLNEVCRQVAEWKAMGFGQIPVAVNVSPAQISRADFHQEVERALKHHDLSPWGLELELTETLLVGGGEESQQQMRLLRAAGITLSIDDFGTGYSSLSYLHRLKVDAIKLDRSFVQSIDTEQAARGLVQAMIGVAQGLGLNVIAEGVERESQRLALISAGCPMMQGYLFSKPRPAAGLRDYLARIASEMDDLHRIATAVEWPLQQV